jgi:hypothetical protein
MKSVLINVFLIVFAFNVKCQILSGFGLKLGIGISNQSWDYQTEDFNMDFDNKLGISPRIFADFFNFPFLKIEAEIGYLRKGFEDKIPITTMAQPDGTGEFINMNITVDYLSISTLVKLKCESEIVSPYIIFGPQLDFLLNKNIHEDWKIIFDKFSNANVNLSVGVGTELKSIFTIPIIVEYRYERDLMDNYDSPNINIKNYTHVFLLGITI